MKNEIICFFTGHKFTHAEYDFIETLDTTILHWGLRAVCSRCDCRRVIEDEDDDKNKLPVLMPK